MKKEITNWKRMIFKGNKVWIALDKSGKPIEENGKVFMKYNIKQDYEYWIFEKSLNSVDDASVEKNKIKNKKQNKKQKIKKIKPEKTVGTINSNEKKAIHIYTDGASSGNPGPSGIGVVLRYDGNKKEISRYIGTATNNIAELKAIETGLRELKKKNLPVRVYTDSSYALGVLSLGWKATKNTDLVNSIKKTISRFSDLRIIKVKGHAGDENNELADNLATSAIKKEKT